MCGRDVDRDGLRSGIVDSFRRKLRTHTAEKKRSDAHMLQVAVVHERHRFGVMNIDQQNQTAKFSRLDAILVSALLHTPS